MPPPSCWAGPPHPFIKSPDTTAPPLLKGERRAGWKKFSKAFPFLRGKKADMPRQVTSSHYQKGVYIWILASDTDILFVNSTNIFNPTIIFNSTNLCTNIETAMLSRHAENVNTCGWWWQERWLVSRVVLTSSSSQVPPILLFLPRQPIDTNNASGTRKPISWRTQNILRRLAIVMLQSV